MTALLHSTASTPTSACISPENAGFSPKATRRGLFSLVAAATAATIPAAASATVKLPGDEAELLKHYRRLSPKAQSEHLGWAKWQADRGR